MCGVIVVDAESIGLLVLDMIPIDIIIAIDDVTTLRGSINCSTVICSPTVILAILREASSEHYGPQGLLHTIFSALHFLLRCTFRFQISLCKQSWRDWQPLWSVGCKFVCVCAGTLDTWLDSPTKLIPWFSNWGKYLRLMCCIPLSPSKEKPTQAQSPTMCQFLAMLFEK